MADARVFVTVLTPRVGSASRATRLAAVTRAIENGVAALTGEQPPDLVNPEAWPA